MAGLDVSFGGGVVNVVAGCAVLFTGNEQFAWHVMTGHITSGMFR